jgi:hypothetical protein
MRASFGERDGPANVGLGRRVELRGDCDRLSSLSRSVEVVECEASVPLFSFHSAPTSSYGWTSWQKRVSVVVVAEAR